MIEYTCADCDQSEFNTKIIPMKTCPNCGYWMEVIEPADY